ncbi:MAG: fatty acid kinase [Pseudonocardiales bacterium]|nr:fatty acid kinase [Pseudonocardiales bacterium]
MLDALDADAVRRWSRSAVELLDTHRAEIDALNVYPVADSDTGSNLLTTLRAADAALAAARPRNAAAALAEMAVGAAQGALGNSGFIVSQILRGFADATTDEFDAPAITAGLDRGAALARTAVVSPVEGTILTVARAASDGAVGDTLGEIIINAVRAADIALQRTPSQLDDLARAGVVDAGGRGLVVLLEALARTITGVVTPIGPVRVPLRSAPAFHEGDGSEFGFEVQYLLDAAPSAVDTLRGALAELGDSVAVVAVGEGVWNVHVHVNDVGAAIEAGVDAGRPSQISVVRFSDQMHDAADDGAIAVVAVAPGTGLAHLFEAEGVQVVEAEPGALPTVDDVLAGIRAADAREVVLLPNASRVTGVAEAAAERARAQGIRVSVVPTRSPVQGLAAIAVHDPARRFDDDVIAMAEAAAATRHAEVTIARNEALTAVGICQPGDVLGLIDDEVVEVGRGLLAVAFTVVDRLLGVGAELMTVLVGVDAPPRTGDLIKAHVHDRAPFTDVTIYPGGQPDHPVIIGVE